MSQPLLSVNGLMMRFGGLLAVNNVSGSASAGDRLADWPERRRENHGLSTA
jgi:ABC-type branched-subunit amino acid transport system ATPase component